MSDPAPGEPATPAVAPEGVRIGWTELPAPVHDWVEEQLGSPVVEARSQRGGFSPGAAERLVAATGRRAFLKAVSPVQNQDSPALLLREADVLRSLPAGLPVPALLAVHDRDGWVALLLEDVAGRHPLTPWQDEEVRAVLAVLSRQAGTAAPASWPALPEEVAGAFTAWSRVARQAPAGLDPWAAGRLTELDDLARATLPRLAGDVVCHSDIRSDNLLVGPDGAVRVVDWPWAARGAPWFDAATLLVNIHYFGGSDLRRHLPAVRDLGAAHEDVLGVVAGLGGYFAEAAALPPSPGLPTLRAFQAGQGRACLAVIRELG